MNELAILSITILNIVLVLCCAIISSRTSRDEEGLMKIVKSWIILVLIFWIIEFIGLGIMTISIDIHNYEPMPGMNTYEYYKGE